MIQKTKETEHLVNLLTLRFCVREMHPEFKVLDLSTDYRHAKVENEGMRGWVEVGLLFPNNHNPFTGRTR